MANGIGKNGQADAGKLPDKIKGVDTGAKGAGTRTARTIALEKSPTLAAGIRPTEQDGVSGVPAGQQYSNARYHDGNEEAWVDQPSVNSPADKEGEITGG